MLVHPMPTMQHMRVATDAIRHIEVMETATQSASETTNDASAMRGLFEAIPFLSLRRRDGGLP